MKLGAAPLALVGLFLACPAAIAQGQAPNATPTPGAAPVPISAPPPPPAQSERQRAEPHADARACLEFPTALQVIACAEKYRGAKRR